MSLDERDMSDLSHRPVIDYMAPELTEDESADERADLYSLGVTIDADGPPARPPFTGTHAEILAARLAGPPPSLERDDLPEALRGLINCLLAPERDRRPSSAAEVVERLEGLRAAWITRAPGAGPTRGDSRLLPAPDPAEVRSSVGAKAAEYAVGDVIEGRFEVLGTLGDGGFSKGLIGCATMSRVRRERSSSSRTPPATRRCAERSAPCERSIIATW